jgi:putative ubiquitin-RnfH superfamily antitoxin RatB of RatAB toxin-antitoxin module
VNKATLTVTVVYSPKPRRVHEYTLELAVGSSVLQAIQASGLLQQFPLIARPSTVLGVWGRIASLAQAVVENDRVEIYRPLTVDPKVARRERFVKQGAKAAGLFAKKRVGAAAGY